MKNKNIINIDNIINELILSKPSHITPSEITKEGDMETDFIAENPFYDKKYREALKFSVKLDVYELGQTQLWASAKDVLIAILKDYDPDIPPPILLEMARVILAEWAILQASKKDLVFA